MRDAMLLATVLLCCAGCDSDCEQVCEASQECNIFDEFILYDCDDACDIAEDIADSRGCGREYDTYYGCLADGQRDECVFIDPCSTEGAAYNSCISR